MLVGLFGLAAGLVWYLIGVIKAADAEHELQPAAAPLQA